MKMNVSYSLNEARITSHTGLKGYSSIQPNIGMLLLDINDERIELKPDMVCGPSSIKGKVNQVRLAQAAYVAKVHYQYREDSIDSMNEQLINELADECPSGVWVDAYGKEHECYFGLVNVAFTDPSVQYSRNSYMGFQFEMLKLAMTEYPDLAKIIMDSRDEDDLAIVKEVIYLEQSLKGNVPKGFAVKQISSFNNYNDAKTIMVPRINSVEILPVVNYLMTLDRAPFILLTSSGKKVYIPSGKTLKSFQSVGANGQWLYDILLVQLSRIFNNVNNFKGLESAVSRYILTIGNRKVLYPELLGLNMKQTTLYNHVNTVSVPSKNLREAKRKIYGEYKNWEDYDLYAIHVRNPA
jgi:hypothetical protein